MEIRTFLGSNEEIGHAQGLIDPAWVQEQFSKRKLLPHDFSHPYFRKNLEFMKREFPGYIDQMSAFGVSAGFTNFDEVYFHHIYGTGGAPEGCSALGIILDEDGPAMLSTNDASGSDGPKMVLQDSYLGVFPSLEPHGFAGIMRRSDILAVRTINDRGLSLGWASGHPKFNWPDNPEYLNLYLAPYLIAQYCGTCEDVRHFLNQYRVSGLKGYTGTAVDIEGNILGIEAESERIAFREPEHGLLLETNHWQESCLQEQSKASVPEFWRSPYFNNSQNRIQYLSYFNKNFMKMTSIEELIDFSFDVEAPGRILQSPGYNIGDWTTVYAVFMNSRDRSMRVHTYPLVKETYTEVKYPVVELD
jgi:hypothetical protein